MNWLRTFASSGMSFFSGVIANWQAFAAVGVVSLGMGAFGTYKIMHNANLAEKTTQAVRTVNLVREQGVINSDLGVLYVPKFVFIASETQRVRTEIPQHVTPEIDRTHPVPLGFVRVWNELPDGPVPPAAAGSDADDSGVALSSVADAGVNTQGALKACLTEKAEWWDWYDKNATVWNKSQK